jgi:O-antigen biosynthesis protein
MATPAPVSEIGERFPPGGVMEVELTKPLPSVRSGGGRQDVWVLGRLHTEPVGGCFVHLGEQGLTPAQLGAQLWHELRNPVTERFLAAGLSAPCQLSGDGLESDPSAWPFLRRQSQVLAAAPFISIVLCTRDRLDQLATCLRHLDRQIYPHFEVVVVENVPTGRAVQALVEARRGGVPYRYVPEPRSGLSWSRNTGIAAASGEIIAFLDDDDEPDDYWLAGLAYGFDRSVDIGCVTGPVVPARLDTAVQELFEQLGGHSKGRGFDRVTFSRHGPQNPLYPLPPFGAGANMAFRRQVLARIGCFDVALGAGTPTLAGADTLAFTLTLLAGYRIAYEPAALMRHHHRRDLEGLRRQLHGYSVGLTAFYAALLRHRPAVAPGLVRLVPVAARYLRSTGAANPSVRPDLLAKLNRRHRRGMMTGPFAYARSVCRQARLADARAVAPGQRR